MKKVNSFINIELEESKKIYFASDNHLGAPNHKESLKIHKMVRFYKGKCFCYFFIRRFI